MSSERTVSKSDMMRGTNMNQFGKENKEESPSTLDPRRTNQAFVKFKIAEFSNFYFGMIGVACGVMEYEISYGDEENN